MNVARAETLHPRLLHLFTRWPPRQLANLQRHASQPEAITITTTESTPPSDPNITNSITTTTSAPVTHNKINPFMPWKNPRTGNWHGAHYSLRRQAEMFKLAKEYGVLSLMPKSPKHPEVKEKNRLERGIRVKGTGVGQKVKGKKWERGLNAKLDKRRQAMADMPELIKQWRQTGSGRGWKKYPK